MHHQIVPYASESLLRTLLHDLSSEVVEDLVMDIRIRNSAAHQASLDELKATYVSVITEGGEESFVSLEALLHCGALSWDTSSFCYVVTAPHGSNKYTILDDEGGLAVTLRDERVPEINRQILQAQIDSTMPSEDLVNHIVRAVQDNVDVDLVMPDVQPKAQDQKGWLIKSDEVSEVASDVATYVEDRVAHSIVTVSIIKSHSHFEWYSEFTRALKQNLGFLYDFAPDQDPVEFTMQYFCKQFHKLKEDNCPFVILVPFFLTRSRQLDGFDVLPYGYLRRFGLLVHHEHPIWAQSQIKASSDQDSFGAWFFQSLLRYAAEFRSRIAFLGGSVFEDLIEDAVACLTVNDWMAEKDARDAVSGFWTSLASGTHKQNYVAVPHFETCQSSENPVGTQDVVLFDSNAINTDLFEDWGKAGYRKLSIEHGLNIPVGIGMSQSLTHYIYGEERWRSCLTAIQPILTKHRSDLSSLGVELDDEFLCRIVGELPAPANEECEAIKD